MHPAQLTRLIGRCGTQEELAEVLTRHAKQMNGLHVTALVEGRAGALDARGIANISWALAKVLRPAHSPGPDRMGDADPGRWEPQHLANTLWAAASLELGASAAADKPRACSPAADGDSESAAGDWVARAVAAAGDMLRTGRFSEAGLSQLVWSVAELGLQPGADWMAAFFSAARRRAAELSPHSAANVLFALARLAAADAGSDVSPAGGDELGHCNARTGADTSFTPPPDTVWLSGFLAETAAGLAAADGAALANSMWALTTLLGAGTSGTGGSSAGTVPRSWLRLWYGAMLSPGALGRLTDAQLSRALWSLASLSVQLPGGGLPFPPPPGLLGEAAAALRPRLGAMPAHSFAMAGWALGRLHSLQEQHVPPHQLRTESPPHGEKPWQPDGAWLLGWANGSEDRMRSGSLAGTGLIMCLQTAAGWGEAAGVGSRWLQAALDCVMRPEHSAHRAQLLLAFLRAADACLPGRCPQELLEVAASAVLAGARAREDGEAGSGSGSWAAGQLLRCGAALARMGYLPPPSWRRVFFARVMLLAELAQPAVAAPVPQAQAAAPASSPSPSGDLPNELNNTDEQLPVDPCEQHPVPMNSSISGDSNTAGASGGSDGRDLEQAGIELGANGLHLNGAGLPSNSPATAAAPAEAAPTVQPNGSGLAAWNGAAGLHVNGAGEIRLAEPPSPAAWLRQGSSIDNHGTGNDTAIELRLRLPPRQRHALRVVLAGQVVTAAPADAALGLLSPADWTAWGVPALARLAHELPPQLQPAWLDTVTRLRGRVSRSALDDLLLGFCLATEPSLQAMRPRALHATLLAAGRLAAALRLALSRDWASAALRRYSRCCGALPPAQLAQVSWPIGEDPYGK
ncbi:hypothetical protein GPECTOR_29g27 [Gonium pectorale]|uniref:Uncharacterized protein n=1 Tax=Gonium pectorale TaxID=33097 RepID=A0A150GEG6_GONPE|nr:hypothetical protein GPECTOR_29g27 [Gonium pectorale]|eukprot:KXZ48247.1 hypothetical protein GPECTOR_29g27 [Gonium pectorale]